MEHTKYSKERGKKETISIEFNVGQIRPQAEQKTDKKNIISENSTVM